MVKNLVVISCKDYDKLKKEETVEMVVIAKGRPNLTIYATILDPDLQSDDSGYEGAIFNGEY